MRIRSRIVWLEKAVQEQQQMAAASSGAKERLIAKINALAQHQQEQNLEGGLDEVVGIIRQGLQERFQQKGRK